MRLRLIFQWYDFWVGFYWDQNKRRLYFFPVPMFGICFDFSGGEVVETVFDREAAKRSIRGGSSGWDEYR